MEIKSDETTLKPKKEQLPALTEYQRTCSNLMLAAQNLAVPDRTFADMLMWDFSPVFDSENLGLTLTTIKAVHSSGRVFRNLDIAIESMLNQSEEDIESAYLKGNEETKKNIRQMYAQTIEFTPTDHLGPTLRFYLRHSGEDLDELIPKRIEKEVLLYKGMVHQQNNPDDHTRELYLNWSKNIFENSISVINRKAALKAINDAAKLVEAPDRYMEKLINIFGIDAKAARKALSASFTQDPEQQDEFIVKNILTMEILERDNPGICKALSEEFGIIDFARYPLQALKTQFVNRNRDVPYGVLIFPQGDYNGAFSQMESQIYILWDNLTKLGYSMRIFESGSRGEVLRALASANNRYGEDNKISFAILGGHGAPLNMRFAQSEFTEHRDVKRTDFVGRRDVVNRRAKQLQDIFVEHPSVVLVACSTGAEAGLGESMSKLGAVVSAPEKIASLGIIKPYKDSDEKIRFYVTYEDSPTAIHFNGAKQS